MNASRMVVSAACLVALFLPAETRAQDTLIVIRPGTVIDVSSRAARRAVTLFNASSTTRVFGRLSVRSSDTYSGDVGVVTGPVRVFGVIEGDLIAINADVMLASGAVVLGDVLVFGGRLERNANARVSGITRRYRDRLSVHRIGDEIELLVRVEERRDEPVIERRRSYTSDARGSIVVSTGGTYNRVEGLPIHVGPRLTWGYRSDVRLRLEALGIVRTAGDLEDAIDGEVRREDVGYTATGEIRFGRSWGGGVTLGARAFDVVAPFESWQLEDEEVGLAAFLFHDDYRDYFLSRGVAGYVDVNPVYELTLSAEVARTEQTSVAARNPWTLFSRDEEWRANPQIDEGNFTVYTGVAQFDSRRSRRYNGSGWFFRAEWERGTSDDVIERVLPLAVRDPLPTDGTYTYDRFFLDFRRYSRVGWSGQLRLRTVFAGWMEDSDPLPVQRRLSLGGPGAMPGFGFRYISCNEAMPFATSVALCDRILLGQVEYRGSLSLDGSLGRDRWGRRARREGELGWGGRWLDWDDWWGDWFWFEGPTFVVFGDVGTGWLAGEDIREAEFDIGAGLEFGSLAVYAAKALTADESLRITFRLFRRF